MSDPDFKKMSDEQLEGIIGNASGGSAASVSASYELQRRHVERATQKLSTPHWTLTPGFWAIILTMIFAAISAWPVIQGWLQAVSTSDKSATVQSPQSQPKSELLPESKTSPSPNKPPNKRLDSDRQKAPPGQL